MLLDVLECQEGLHNCSQNCDELEGGFSCSCNAGYTLAIDYVTCEGNRVHNLCMYYASITLLFYNCTLR